MSSRLSSNHLLISALAKRQRSKNPLQAGFTLVELLIVVIIIGILAAVALPVFLNQSEKAREQAAKGAAAAAARACQVTLVTGDPYVAPAGITPATCTTSTAIVYTGADKETATVTLKDGNPSRPVYVAGT